MSRLPPDWSDDQGGNELTGDEKQLQQIGINQCNGYVS
jgi:hypothetical protein